MLNKLTYPDLVYPWYIYDILLSYRFHKVIFEIFRISCNVLYKFCIIYLLINSNKGNLIFYPIFVELF